MLPPGATVREAGLADSEKPPTDTVRVAGVLDAPPLSVTVSDAVYVPGVEYVTLPGVATLLELGVPPENDQAYAVMLPSPSVPVPANDTLWPGFTATSPAGLVIVAVGA